MTCHCCRQPRPFLLFARWCVSCWRSHTMRQLDRASQDFLHPCGTRTAALSRAGMRSNEVQRLARLAARP